MLLRSIIVLLLFNLVAYSQTKDTAIVLKEIEVFSPRFNKLLIGFKTQTIDSAQMGDNCSFSVSELLQRNSSVFMKSYGLGSLSTISINGTGSSNTAVLWNGFNLQSPMLGLTDFALLPSMFVDELVLQHGGTVALFGGGATGGSIQLNSKPKYNHGFSISSQQVFASFDHKQVALSATYGNNRFYSTVKWFNTRALNNMPFYNTTQLGSPKQYLQNAELKNNGLLFESGFKSGTYNTFSIKYWYMFSDREIPSTLTSGYSLSQQKDQSNRSSFEWKLKKANWQLNTRAAWLNELIFFNDPLIKLNSRSFSDVVIGETEFSININRHHLLNVGLNNTFSKAISNEYDQEHFYNRFSTFASYRYSMLSEKLLFNLSLRQEASKADFENEYNLIPLVYSIGSEYYLKKHFKLYGSFSKNYRLPTINDLYWVPGGNRSLKPEEGFTETLGLKYIKEKSKNVFSLDVSGFYTNIHNWIMWTPVTPFIWTPLNANKVRSLGGDMVLSTNFNFKKFALGLQGGFNYTSSINTKTYHQNDASLNKQLIYVPIIKGYANVSFSVSTFKCIVFTEHTGKRFVSTDNIYYLNPFTLCGVTLLNKFSFSECNLEVFARADNLFNIQYQLIAWRPMPLRNYQLGIRISFHKKSNLK